jgi:hypothetical protein
MTLHGLLGHTTSLGVSVREDLRHFYNSCDNDAKRMYHQTIELLLEKGGVHFYPAKNPEYMSLKKLLVSDEPVVFSLLDGIQS